MNRVGLVLSNRYELLKILGSGGMADVYLASDRKLNRKVAVKILRNEFSSDESFISRFRQEAMAAACIQNPCVVNIYDGGEDNSVNYIVMELAEGITLKEYIQQKGKLDIIEAINIAMQIVSGIREAHLNGIIHRDIKPQNVMILKDGRAKVMDFGIAKAVTAQTITANTVGSVHYISPEQARGSVCDERCDLYSIGITMYEMITGRVPFDGESTIAVALAHIKEPITPPSTYDPMIPVSLEKIIMKCTQKKPELRYVSADELLADLKHALMTPDEDFVKEVAVNDASGGTRIFTEEETRKIKEQAEKKTVVVKTQEEEDYQLGLEKKEDIDSADEELEDEADGRMEKIFLGVGIIALIIVVLIAGMLAAHAMNLFHKEPGQDVISTNESSQSDQEHEVPLSNLAGKTGVEAEALLKEAGLYQYTINNESSATVAAGTVIRVKVNGEEMTEPEMLVDKDALIDLYVSSGINTIPIPQTVIGMEKTAAKTVLNKLELEIEFEEGTSEKIDKGCVYDCNPTAGSEVPVGSKVILYISIGPYAHPVKVPSLVEQTAEVAKYMLKTADLTGNATFEYSDTVPNGNVIRQTVEAGTLVERGSTVDYVVSLGPETVMVSVPKVTGYTLEEAQSILEREGLKIGSVKEDYSDSAEEGIVIFQSLEPGGQVEEGTSVNIVVSKGPEIVDIPVPSIEGDSEENALEKLESAGLKGKLLGEETNAAPAGTVIRTEPGAGSMVTPGSTVGYYISAGETEESETEEENE